MSNEVEKDDNYYNQIVKEVQEQFYTLSEKIENV
jgi:hypothetical protein